MKKLLSILLVSVVAMSMLAGCGAKEETKDAAPAATEAAKTDTATTTTDSAAATTDAAAGSIVKLGLGVVTSANKSKAMADGKATGAVDTVMIAAGFDKDGKVVKVDIDFAQTSVAFDKDMQITSDLKAELKTKKELGDDYGMKKASAIGKEWYEQAAALEKWMTGKTVDEIKAMKTTEKDGKVLANEADLTSSITVGVADFIAAIDKAYASAIEVKGGAEKIGLGQSISIAKSKGYASADGKETLPVAETDTPMAALAFGADGKVAGAIIDFAQTQIAFDKAGQITTDLKAGFKTKDELGDAYGMKKASSIGKEWNEQAKALADWMVGKSIDDIKNIKTVDKDGKKIVDDADLKSSVTVGVADYIGAAVEASDKAI